MRLALLLAVLLAAPALYAQADPNPPEAYYPLHVGDVWEYEVVGLQGPTPYRRVRALRDSTISGKTYTLRRSVQYRIDGTEGSAWTSLERFDVPTSIPVRWDGSADAPMLFVCPFDLPFPPPGERAHCGTAAFVRGALGETVDVGGQTVVTAVRVFDSVVGFTTYAAGLGRVESNSSYTDRLVYARIDGREIGRRITVLPPVAGESAAVVASALALTAAPNPTSGALRLALALPEAQTVTAEAFDALGRRVWEQTAALGAGPQALSVDASAWAPGVYVVRVTAGAAQATVRVVRR